MVRDRFCHEAGVVADVRSCVVDRVAVEHFFVEASLWYAHSILAHHWSEVAAYDEEVVWIFGLANVAQDAVL